MERQHGADWCGGLGTAGDRPVPRRSWRRRQRDDGARLDAAKGGGGCVLRQREEGIPAGGGDPPQGAAAARVELIQRDMWGGPVRSACDGEVGRTLSGPPVTQRQ